MLFYRESDYHGQLKNQVDKLVGNVLDLKMQMKVGHSGSALYRLNEMTIRNELIDSSHLNVRCNFEKRSNGLILHINEKQKLYSIAIDNDSISKIVVTNEEHISLRFLSPMWILLKLGVHIKYARRFRRMTESWVEPSYLTIETVKGKLTLESNGYNFYSSVRYFGANELKSKLEIIDIKN